MDMSLSQGPPRPPAPGIPRNILEARARTTVLSQRQRPPRRAVASPPRAPADARRADVVAGTAQGSQPRDTDTVDRRTRTQHRRRARIPPKHQQPLAARYGARRTVVNTRAQRGACWTNWQEDARIPFDSNKRTMLRVVEEPFKTLPCGLRTVYAMN